MYKSNQKQQCCRFVHALTRASWLAVQEWVVCGDAAAAPLTQVTGSRPPQVGRTSPIKKTATRAEEEGGDTECLRLTYGCKQEPEVSGLLCFCILSGVKETCLRRRSRRSEHLLHGNSSQETNENAPFFSPLSHKEKSNLDCDASRKRILARAFRGAGLWSHVRRRGECVQTSAGQKGGAN